MITTLISSFVLSLVGVIACYWAAGPSLGVFFGSLAIIALLLPPMMTVTADWRERAIVFAAILIPHIVTWQIVQTRTNVRLIEFLNSAIVLVFYSAAIAGIAVLGTAIARLRTSEAGAVVASALSVLLALASLTWPIWMSKTWNGSDSSRTVDRSIAIHPAFVINRQLINLSGPWTEQSIAYRLTDLNQDVPYSPPATIWACFLVHAFIAGGSLGLAGLMESRNKKRPTPLNANSSANTEKSANAV